MHLAVYLPLVAPLVAGGSARWLAARFDPRVATWVLTAVAVVLAAASGAALMALAATAVGQVPVVAWVGHWSVGVLRRDDPASLVLALAAGVVVSAALVAALRVLGRRVRAIIAAARTARCLPGAGQLVVLDDPNPDAYALPGWPGRIVVSTGMLDALDARERRVLLAHERAHLACGHHLFVVVAQLAAAANPLLRPVATAVGYTTERWADEHAARFVGDRRLAARTIGKAALLTPRRHRPAIALAITGGADRPPKREWAQDLRGVGPVPRRVAALLAPPVRHRPVLLGVVLVALVIASGATLEAGRDLHGLFELARAAAI
jgi:Zn-dependent protease with chaperone function